LRVLEQAVRAVGSLNDEALSDYARKATFETVLEKKPNRPFLKEFIDALF
jgi:hypothetical protein